MKRAAVLLATLFLAAPAAAKPLPKKPPTVDRDLLHVAVGWFDLNKQVEEALDFRLEYRPRYRIWWEIMTWGGIELTNDDARYAVVGFWWERAVGRRWVVGASTGVGAFDPGQGKDLGYDLEFRSTLEAGYRFPRGGRLTLGFGHLSNAYLSDFNPGAEVLTVGWGFPLGRGTPTAASP